MKKVSISKIACGVLLLLISCHIAWYWQRLPEVVISHFGANWEPNGSMSREMFMLTYVGLVGLIALSFLGSSALMRRMPLWMINLPRKEYWFAPERKEQTIDYLSETLLRFHNITQTFIAAIMHIVIEYNVNKQPVNSDTFWILFTAYMTYTILWSVMLMVKFARPSVRNDL